MKNHPDFILFGEGNYNTLGVLYQLAEIGINPLLLIVGKAKDHKHGNLVGYSKYAKRIIEVKTPNEGLSWILNHKNEFEKDSIIYPTSDVVERLLDSNFDMLSDTFRFPNAGLQGEVSKLMNKDLQTRLANESDIRIINSQFTNSPDFSLEKINYPCFVKTLNSTEGSKSDMAVCENETELKQILDNKEIGKEFIVQDFIHNEKDLLFLGVAFDDRDVWIPAVVIKPGVSFRGEYSHAIISTDVDNYLPEVSEVKEFVKKLKYKGPFSIEFAHEKGKNYFLEINLRNDGTSHYPLGLGVNIAKAYIENQTHEFNGKSEYEMIDETADLRRVLYKEISLGNWFKLFRNAGSYRFYSNGDNKLIIPLFYMFFSRTISKLLKR